MDTPESQQILNELEKLAQSPGYIFAMAAMCRNDNFIGLDEATTIDWQERLSYQEFSLLSGYLVKTPVSMEPITEAVMQDYITKTYELTTKLHMHTGYQVMDQLVEARDLQNADPGEQFKQVFGNGTSMVEPIFYSDSGAYDFQYLEYAPKLYELDTGWLQTNKGLNLKIAAEIYKASNELMNRKSNARLDTTSFETASSSVLEGLCITPAEFASFKAEDVEAYFGAFSITPGTANQKFSKPGDYNEFDAMPLIKLPNGAYFVPVNFNVARSMYESPFYWMLGDKTYAETASTHRGDVTEAIVTGLMAKVFGSAKVHNGVKIRAGKTDATNITDIDTLALLGNRAIVLQSKAKKLTLPARGGDEASLKKDFEGAVQDAYSQALISRTELLANKNTFILKDDAELKVPSLEKVYIICVTTDFYPAVSHQASTYLKREESDPIPITISVFDLDLMAQYLADPFDFAYYVNNRIELADYYIASNEMILLAFHLNQKLFRIPGRTGEMLTPSFGQLLDADLLAKRGMVNAPDPQHSLRTRWKNANFETILSQLKLLPSEYVVNIVFFFMNLSSDTIDDLTKNIESTNARSEREQALKDFSMPLADGVGGFTFMATPDPTELQRKLGPFAELKRYQTKANEWVGLGSIAGEPGLFNAVFYMNRQWEPDATMDSLVNRFRTGTVVNATKIGRNEKCPCGSGKKYKHCHLNQGL